MKPTRRGIERRLDKLEQSIGQMATRWYSLSRWRSARADALTLDDQEARDLADFRDDAKNIAEHYAQVKRIRAEVQATLTLFGDPLAEVTR